MSSVGHREPTAVEAEGDVGDVRKALLAGAFAGWHCQCSPCAGDAALDVENGEIGGCGKCVQRPNGDRKWLEPRGFQGADLRAEVGRRVVVAQPPVGAWKPADAQSDVRLAGVVWQEKVRAVLAHLVAGIAQPIVVEVDGPDGVAMTPSAPVGEVLLDVGQGPGGVVIRLGVCVG